MVLYLPEDESFSMTAYVESPGFQRIALKGYLIKKTLNGTYVASLLPSMFYGVSGTQLTSWRQNIPTAGSQVILSRGAGGYPKVPKQDIYWRKVAEPERVAEVEVAEVAPVTIPEIPWPTVALLLGIGVLAYLVLRK